MKQMFDFSKINLKGESSRGLKWEYIPTKAPDGNPIFNLKLEIPEADAQNISGIRSDGYAVNYLSHFKRFGLQFSLTEGFDTDLGSAYNNGDRGAWGFEESLEKSIENYLRKLGNKYASPMSTMPTQLLSTLAICSAGACCRILQERFQSALSSFDNGLLELIIIGFCYDIYAISYSIGVKQGFERLWQELPEEVQVAFPLIQKMII